MANKRPSLQFYPGDWLRDNVSGCSLQAQGLWLRMLMVMHDCENYGCLSVNGLPIKSEIVARRCGCLPEEYDTLLSELTDNGVPSTTEQGVIFSRRMVNDEIKRKQDAEYKRLERERKQCGKSGKSQGDVSKPSGGCQEDVRKMSGGCQTPSSTSSSSSTSVKKVKDKKKKFGSFKNVLLTAKEHEKLTGRFGSSVGSKIENLSLYVESKGARYKSHYATILAWSRNDKGDSGGKTGEDFKEKDYQAAATPSDELPEYLRG